MKPLTLVGVNVPSLANARNVLIPIWIGGFGFVVLATPVAGVLASVALLLVGVVVIPAVAMTVYVRRLPPITAT